MAYALRYYKEITQKDGSVFRLEIHKKDSTASAVEIGAVVQGLSLEIQGQQGEIDTPIVKTSLSMTFVDAGDVEDGRKNGFWEEFYTPDALLWKVILKAKNATENTFRTVWGGYVTPDSYSESLVYRGSVNIIARDNIGHMQDFPFDASGDADGLISLYNLVNAGWEKIASPMSLSWGGEWLYCEGVPAYDTLMNVSAFEGKNWYEAIESALASYGLVMRYVGDNLVQVSSLRSMPGQGNSVDSLPRIEPRFMAGAQRDLIPAVRRIEESVDYDIASKLQPLITADDYSGETYQVINDKSEYLPFLAFDLANKNIGGWSAVTDNGSFFVDFSQYYFHSNVSDSDEEQIKKETYLIANVAQTLYQVEYTKAVNAGDMQIVLKFGRPIGAWREYDSNGRPLGNWFPGYSNGRVTSVVYGVAVTQNGITSYLQEDGEWGEEKAELVHDGDGLANLAIPVGLSEFTGVVDVTLFLYSVKATCAAIQLAALEFSPSENISYRAKNNVNTVYNAENNVILSRTPEFGPAFDRVTLPAFIKNGIFYRNGDAVLPARAWAWSGGTPQQMAVYNHLQLLCYYAKPNNQISGTIVNADLTTARAIYEWHGKEHLLVSGRYDFLTGFIEGAVLREFIRYDDMWGEVSEALLPDTEENSKSNIEAGTGSSGSSSTYTNTTTVNIGSGGGGASYLNDLLDVNTEATIAKSVLYYDGNVWIDKNVATILDEVLQSAKTIAGWFKKDDNGDIYTEVNFYSKKTVASGGKGTAGTGGGTGTVMAVSVNGTTYDSVDGIVTIPDYPTKVSQLDNDRSYATTVQLTTDLMSKQDRITADNPLSAELISGLGELAFKDVADLSSDYLLLTGGTITGTLVKRNTGQNYITFQDSNGNSYGYLGFNGANTPIYMPKEANTIYTLLHSGNVGEYKAGDSDKLDGINSTGFALISSYPNTSDSNWNIQSGVYRTFPGTNDLPYEGAGHHVIHLNWDENAANQLFLAHSIDHFSFRRKESNVWQPWKTIAFTDSTVEKAKQLANARTIWGQSFDGTGNVELPAQMQYLRFINIDGSTGSYIGRASSRNNDIILYIPTADKFTISTNGEQRMLINSLGNILIGTTTDNGAKLQVKGNSIAITDTQITYQKGAEILFLEDSRGYLGAIKAIYELGNWEAENVAAGSLRFYTSNHTTPEERMRITAGGNVLIGTTEDLGGKLQVAGNMYLKEGYLFFEGDTVTGSSNMYLSTHDAAGLNFRLSTGATRFFIATGSGNVGIGTDDPAYKLDVNGKVRVTSELRSNIFYFTTDKVDKGWFGSPNNTTSSDWCLFVYDGNIRFGTNSNERMRITSGGNVGIDTPDPQYKLDVSGTGHFTGAMTLDSTLTAGATDLASLTVTGVSTFTGNTTHKGIAYFANGTSYYINAGGAAKFVSLSTGAITASTITASGLITANAGLTIPTGQKLAIGGATLEWDGSALKITGNAYATGTLATGGRATAGTAVGLSTADIMPALNYKYYIGTTENYYIGVYANSLFCGSRTNNMNLIGGNGSTYGMRFRLSNFATTPTYTELGYWNASGMTINTKLKIGTVDVGAKLTELENRLAAIGG